MQKKDSYPPSKETPGTKFTCLGCRLQSTFGSPVSVSLSSLFSAKMVHFCMWIRNTPTELSWIRKVASLGHLFLSSPPTCYKPVGQHSFACGAWHENPCKPVPWLWTSHSYSQQGKLKKWKMLLIWKIQKTRRSQRRYQNKMTLLAG